MSATMENHSDLVKIYFECTAALDHFKKQHASIQRHTLLFRRSSNTRKYFDTLEEIQSYLKKAQWHTLAKSERHSASLVNLEDFLEGETLKTANDARLEEGIILNNMVNTLLAVRVCLVEDMTTSDIRNLMEKHNQEELFTLLSVAEKELKEVGNRRDAIAAKYSQKNRLSKKDFKQELTEAEYSKNKRLNKFEEDTDKKIDAFVSEILDREWQNHLMMLPLLQIEVSIQEANAHRWNDKVQALKTFSASADNGKVSEEEVDDNEHTSSIDSSMQSAPMSSTESTKPAVHSALPMHENPNPPTQPTLSVADTDTSDNGNDEPPRTQTVTTETHLKEDSFTFITKREYEYEYEHNKENKPTISLPVIDKQSANTAFAGLDKYARDVFSRSPSLKSPTE